MFAKGRVLVLAAVMGSGIAMGQVSKVAPVDVALTYNFCNGRTTTTRRRGR